MNVSIQQVKTANGPRWQVRMDQHGVSFRSEAEAQQFLSVLRTRLQAPHPLPWRATPTLLSAS